MKTSKSGNGRVVMAIVIIIAILFSAISIYSSSYINKNLNTLSVHPFAVSGAVNRLKLSVASAQIRMSRLTLYNSEEDVELVRDAAKELENGDKSNIEYVINYYLGPQEEAQRMNELLNLLYEKEEEYLDGASSRTIEENSLFVTENMNDIFEEFDALTATINQFIENTVSRLSNSSNKTQHVNVATSILVSILLIILAILYQRSADRRMKDQEAYYRDFLFNILSENIDTVFMIYSLEKHQMEFVSPNTDRALGISSHDLENGSDSIFSYCKQEECGEVEQAFKSEILQTRTEVECLMKNPKNNTERSMKIVIYPTREGGMTNRYIISLTDQTDIKRNQQVLRDALLNAQNANRAKSDFLSHMSHEIRTPMNAIIGMCTIAGASKHNPDRVEDCLSKIMSSSKHLLLLINDILDMSKIESGKLAVANEPFMLNEVINNISTIIYDQAKAKGQQFEITGLIEHEELIGDALHLNQILINLLSNAVKYTPENGTVGLRMEEVGKFVDGHAHLRFTISDNGIGMSKEFQERVFVPFEQEGQVSGGTGLGLAITKNLITLANGTIAVESEMGKGSSFIVELPFLLANTESFPEQSKEVGELKALIVDDDRDTCEHVSIILKRLGVYNKWVLSGGEGVEYAIRAYQEHNSYDVVFMDWKMPDMDGIEATKRIRKIVGPDTLIIIISAVNWEEIADEARKAGVNDFITKPMFQSTIYNTLLRTRRKGSVSTGVELDQMADFSGKRILLVEDNELNLEIAQELLTIANATVETAVNGQLGVERFIESIPGYYDVILMDVQMPVMDGYTATRTIRASNHPQADSIPIIAMTANAFSEDVSAALQAGMNAHIAKPIDIELLYTSLKKIFNKHEARKDTQYNG